MQTAARHRPGSAIRRLLAAFAACAALAAGAAAPFEFHAKDAKIAAAGSIRFEEKPGFQNIGAWNNTNAVVRWNAAELPKGTYRVRIVFACANDNPGSAFEVNVGGQRANFTVLPTGGWTVFQEADLGPVIIRKTGPAEVTARITRIPHRWAINLRTIRLEPES